LKPISADIIEKYSYSQFEPFVYFGDGAGKLQELWKGRNCIADTSITSSAKGQTKLAFEKYRNQEFEDVAYFEPFYLKDFVSNAKKTLDK
jgi:tRNA threonylcarbamoyladenosine biosynthesis protein TsaB